LRIGLLPQFNDYGTKSILDVHQYIKSIRSDY
jgi:hypothetical protein